MRKLTLICALVCLAFPLGITQAQTVITNQAELQAIGTDVTTLAGDYVLGNDLVLTGEFTTITNFTGTFDGAMHTIDGLTTSVVGLETNGLFGQIEAGSLVENVGLINANITVDATTGNANYVAALVGDVHGTVRKCWLEGGSVSLTGATSGNNAGSLVGLIRGTGSVSDSYVLGTSVTIEGLQGIGGFANQGTITNCYVAGEVNLTPRSIGYAGGFV